MNLLNITDKKNYLIVKVNGDKDLVHRLITIGIAKGKTLSVFAHSKNGPLIIKIDGAKIGIGHKAAKCVIVESVDKKDINEN